MLAPRLDAAAIACGHTDADRTTVQEELCNDQIFAFGLFFMVQ